MTGYGVSDLKAGDSVIYHNGVILGQRYEMLVGIVVAIDPPRSRIRVRFHLYENVIEGGVVTERWLVEKQLEPTTRTIARILNG